MYSTSEEVQEPHPQPPPRLQGGGYDVAHVIRKRYIFQYSYYLGIDKGFKKLE